MYKRILKAPVFKLVHVFRMKPVLHQFFCKRAGHGLVVIDKDSWVHG